MDKKKENDVICNGGMPPQMADIMEAYTAYTNVVASVWYAWAAMSGLKYYTDRYWSIVKQMDKDRQ